MRERVLITGARGFVGSRLISQLSAVGTEVMGIDSASGVLLDSDVKIKQLDIFDTNLYDLVDNKTTIVHLAAASSNNSFDNEPERALQLNLVGTQRVIDIANRKKAKKLIFASSEWVYPECQEHEKQYEVQKINPFDLKSFYGQSKILGELLLTNWSNVPTVILRFGIIFAERDEPKTAIEVICKNLVTTRSVNVGNLHTARRFIHEEEIVKSLIRVIDSNLQFEIEVFNLTGNELVSLKKIAQIVKGKVGFPIEVSVGNTPASVRNPVNDKFNRVFGVGHLSKQTINQRVVSLCNFYSRELENEPG